MASHRVSGRKLSRYKDQRKALMRGLVSELITHERITTTLAKAKETRIVAEKLITHGKKGSIHHRSPVRRQGRWVHTHSQAWSPLRRCRPDGSNRARVEEQADSKLSRPILAMR